MVTLIPARSPARAFFTLHNFTPKESESFAGDTKKNDSKCSGTRNGRRQKGYRHETCILRPAITLGQMSIWQAEVTSKLDDDYDTCNGQPLGFLPVPAPHNKTLTLTFGAGGVGCSIVEIAVRHTHRTTKLNSTALFEYPLSLPG